MNYGSLISADLAEAVQMDRDDDSRTREGMSLEARNLVLRARAGDCEAFERLMILHQRQVLGTAVRILHRLEDAKDAAQEVFLKLYRYLPRIRADAELSGLHKPAGELPQGSASNGDPPRGRSSSGRLRVRWGVGPGSNKGRYRHGTPHPCNLGTATMGCSRCRCAHSGDDWDLVDEELQARPRSSRAGAKRSGARRTGRKASGSSRPPGSRSLANSTQKFESAGRTG